MWRVYWRVVAQLAPERRLAMALVVADLLLAGLYFLEPWLFGRVVDSLVAKSPHLTWHLISIWAGFGVFGIIAGVWVSLQADRLAHRRRLAAITQFFEHAVALPLAFHGEHHTGRLLRIMNTATSHLFGIWLGFLREHLATMLSIVVTIPLAMRMSWKMALLMVGLMVSFALFNAIAMRRTEKAQSKVEELHHEMAERASDVLSNAMIVQSFTRQEAEAAGIRALTQKVLAAQYPVLRGWAWLSVANRTASTMTIMAIFALGSVLNARGEISVGTIVTFSGIAMSMIGKLEQFTGFISGLFFQTPALRDFFDVLDTPSVLREDGNRPDLATSVGGRIHGEVEFQNVSFGYSAAHTALESLNFKAPAGATVALVGPTGAGKTTALSLLYRAYDPTVGRITIDGVDIRDVGLTSLRSAIAVVFQDAGLLYRSIADNLRLGNPQATMEQLEVTAKAAEAHDFIVVKPQGYGTLVAERGRSLSGGERQRLAIARAMLKDAPILILDEATSALDNVTEARIQRALTALCAGRTTFVIAHRLSTVRHADLILVLKGGKLVECGNYSALMAQNGLFAELNRQGEFAEDAHE